MYIDVNNIKIHYEISGKGKTIILLNPNSTNTNAMKFIAKNYQKNIKFIYLIEDVVVKVKEIVF